MFDDSGPDGQPPTPPCDPNLPEFKIGMKMTDSTGAIAVRLVDGPVPPQKNYNTWKISIEDASGQPITNAKMNWACAWMEVHQHGSNPQAITNMGGGKYELTKQNLSMYGPWQVRMWIDPTGAGTEYQPQSAGAQVAAGNECMPTNGAKPSPNVKLDLCVPQTAGM